MSDQSAPLGWPGQPPQPAFPGAPTAPVAGSPGAHPLLWARMPAEIASPPAPRSPEEALAMMERSHAATFALLPEDADTDADSDETTPLTRAWFDSVREACARTGRVPGVERMLFEWWINDPPIEDLVQLPWLFGVWQGHWVCWAGTTPWAAADLAAKSTFDAAQLAAAVQFGADPEHPPATPWPPFGTSALAVPTTILLALSGQPAPKTRLIPTTPLYVAPAPPPPPPPPPAPAPLPDPPALVVEPEPTLAPVAADAAAVGALTPEGEITPTPEVEVEPDGAVEPGADAPVADADDIADTPDADAGDDAPVEPEAAPETESIVDDAPAPEPAMDEPPVGDPEPEPAAVVAPVAPIEDSPAPHLPPPGWFPDPAGRHALRYWDGTDWTAHAADPGSDTINDPI